MPIYTIEINEESQEIKISNVIELDSGKVADVGKLMLVAHLGRFGIDTREPDFVLDTKSQVETCIIRYSLKDRKEVKQDEGEQESNASAG